MTSSAKVTISEIDKSAIVSSMQGIYAGIVINSDKGDINTPRLITDINKLITAYGKPNPKLGTTFYSALNYLAQGDKLWVVRAGHEDAKYAAAVVRGKITDIPTKPVTSLSDECLIVKPISGGLTQEELDQYQFDLFKTNKLYVALTATLYDKIDSDGSGKTTFRVSNINDLKVGDSISLSTNSLADLNDDESDVGENTPSYEITNLETKVINYELAKVDRAVTVTEGSVVYSLDSKVDEDSGETLYTKKVITNNPVVVRSASNSTTFLVSNSDYIATDDLLAIGGSAPDGEYHALTDIDGVQCKFIQKTITSEDGYYITVDSNINYAKDNSLFKVKQFETEYRDAFLVVAKNQGKWGNKISIGVEASPNYDNAFYLKVYNNGVQVESYEVTRDYSLDGFGRQMEMEQKINGNSAYILVKNNTKYVTEDNEGNESYPLPLDTDYSLWIQDPEDIFLKTPITLTENLLINHNEVKLSSVEGLEVGDRIKFEMDCTSEDTYELSAEYKIKTIDSVNNTLILDRTIIETEIDSTYIDYTGTTQDAHIFRFDSTYVDEEQYIDEGVKYYPITKLNSTYPAKPLESALTISSLTGKLVDCGTNLMLGGDIPTAVTQGDMITALKTLHNREKTPIQLFMDGGYATPAYAQAIFTAVEAQGYAFGYLSTPLKVEESDDYVTAIKNYRNSLNLNTAHCSLFCGWVKVFDSYNQINTWVSPEGFAAASQSMVTRVYTIFEPAAGWIKGMVTALDVKIKPNQGERDALVESQLNPIRYKEGTGLSVWANETLYTKPSPLQMRSVAMLIVKIKTDIDPMLENVLFELNNESTWSRVEGALEAYFRDEIKAKGGVYDYQIKITDIITDSDIDNRRMPVFIGIQPTSDINFIPVSLTIFNKGTEISVS